MFSYFYDVKSKRTLITTQINIPDFTKKAAYFALPIIAISQKKNLRGENNKIQIAVFIVESAAFNRNLEQKQRG